MTAVAEISYKGFCALGGLTNPKLFTQVRRNGTYVYSVYYLRLV